MAVEKALVSGIQITKLYNLLEKNRVLYKHLINVMQISTSIALQMNLSNELLEVVRRSALLHDIGKLEVFNKKLTMPQHHPIKGSELLIRRLNNTKLLGFNEIVKTVHHHHERWDGQGYPDGLKGDEIPIAARIIAVADAYDDMTSGSPYRKRMSSKDAFKQILESTGTQFDPEVVAYFVLTDCSPYL